MSSNHDESQSPWQAWWGAHARQIQSIEFRQRIGQAMGKRRIRGRHLRFLQSVQDDPGVLWRIACADALGVPPLLHSGSIVGDVLAERHSTLKDVKCVPTEAQESVVESINARVSNPDSNTTAVVLPKNGTESSFQLPLKLENDVLTSVLFIDEEWDPKMVKRNITNSVQLKRIPNWDLEPGDDPHYISGSRFSSGANRKRNSNTPLYDVNDFETFENDPLNPSNVHKYQFCSWVPELAVDRSVVVQINVVPSPDWTPDSLRKLGEVVQDATSNLSRWGYKSVSQLWFIPDSLQHAVADTAFQIPELTDDQALQLITNAFHARIPEGREINTPRSAEIGPNPFGIGFASPTANAASGVTMI